MTPQRIQRQRTPDGGHPLLAGQVIPSPVGARRIAAALLSAAATAEEAER